jgi:Domain of unknown function (DUF5668)
MVLAGSHCALAFVFDGCRTRWAEEDLMSQELQNRLLSPKFLVGLGFISFGGLLALREFGVINVERLLPWWPVVLIVVGLAKLLQRGFLGSLGGHILIGLGFIFLALQFERYWLLEHGWPFLIIWVGLIITVRAFRPSSSCTTSRTTDAHER